MFLDGVMWLWYVLTALSVIYLLWDQFVNTPSMRIMTWAWFLVILYTGPIGLFFYLISCRQPLPGMHEAFIKAHWKQALGSEIHCVAGDATGIIISAFIMSFFRIPNGWETIIEYAFAYLFGLLLFQALFMLSMFKNYSQAVYKTIFAETVSMNFVMIGMLPLVVILRHIWPKGLDPAHAEFWFIMSIATLGGFVIGYPINSYLVRKHEKHGMMSKPSSTQGHKMTPGMSEHSPMQNMGSEKECCGTCGGKCHPKDDKPHHHEHHAHHGPGHDKPKPHEHHSPKHHHDHHEHHDHHDLSFGHDHHKMQKEIGTFEKWAWVIGSYALLIGIFWIISIWVPVRFS